MFDSKLLFKYKGNFSNTINGFEFKKHIYTFKGLKSNKTYIVEFDEHTKFLIYIIKFYLKSHRASINKFSIRTNEFEANICIATIIRIMLEVYNKNPYASFGFLGSHDIGQSTSFTKRYRLYKKVMEFKFSPLKFKHFNNPNYSAYLLLNKDFINTNTDYLKELEKYFITLYPDIIEFK